ncbi:MAG: ATP-binding protein [Planctomycetaceae bacterium]|nr:hypothetical protein [Planctomycetales bacterium]MCB9923037.1 ATP-binding protein [Planctomycetaceae bacterium]
MSGNAAPLIETVTLGQAQAVIRCMAHEQSILLLSPPGVGKSDSVIQVSKDSGLECRSLLGTQIAPEDVSGIPRIVGERSVFCPPRVLLPEDPQPFCLFLDELPTCAPDIQKAFYSLLLERRLGEHKLPEGTWVVAAGNRAEDRSLVRSLSAALVNRVTILNLRVDNNEWLQWARANRIRSEILAFVSFMPEVLMRQVPANPVPFSTPRSWAQLSRALDLAEESGILDRQTRRALAFGRVTAADAALFCTMADENLRKVPDIEALFRDPSLLPNDLSARRSTVGRPCIPMRRCRRSSRRYRWCSRTFRIWRDWVTRLNTAPTTVSTWPR